jgi:hypothetical protein
MINPCRRQLQCPFRSLFFFFFHTHRLLDWNSFASHPDIRRACEVAFSEPLSGLGSLNTGSETAVIPNRRRTPGDSNTIPGSIMRQEEIISCNPDWPTHEPEQRLGADCENGKLASFLLLGSLRNSDTLVQVL